MQPKKRSILDNSPIVKKPVKSHYQCEDKYICWCCLCDVCTRIHCFRRNFVKSKLDRCFYCQENDLCPITHCDFFEHQKKFKRFRIVHKKKKYDTVFSELRIINEKIAVISENLEQLTKG